MNIRHLALFYQVAKHHGRIGCTLRNLQRAVDALAFLRKLGCFQRP